MINNGTVFNDQFDGRILDATKYNERETVPSLEVEVIAGAYSNATQLSFRWNVTYENEGKLDI